MMERLQVFTHPYLGIYTKCFLWQTENYNVWIDGGIGNGWKLCEPYLTCGKKNVMLLTHAHWDHVAGVTRVQETGGVLYAHRGDERYLTDPAWHWELLFGQFANDFTVPPQRRVLFDSTVLPSRGIDEAVSEGDVLAFDDLRFRVIETPGHSNGSVCFWEETTDTLFTGDSLSDTGFFTGPLQLVSVEDYIASMNKLSCLQVGRVITDHTEDMDGTELAAVARKGAQSARTMRAAVLAALAQGEGSVQLGEMGRIAAESIGKKTGGGACITALNILCRCPDERARLCAGRYLCGC